MHEVVDLLAPERLERWRMAGQGGFRLVGLGIVESYGGPGLYWYPDEAFGDFTLSVEWRSTRIDDNSGLFIRCPPLGDDPAPAIERGYEIQIDEHGVDPEAGTHGSPLHMTGAIYKLAPALRRCSRPVREWNHFEVRADRASLQVLLNGEEVSRLQDASREPRGHVGLQAHHDASAVQFRRLLIHSRC